MVEMSVCMIAIFITPVVIVLKKDFSGVLEVLIGI
jgi:hypothetical protein